MATTKRTQRMPVAERRARVHAMHRAGKPQRVIAAELGISKDTVWRDIHTVTTAPATPATPPVPSTTPTIRLSHQLPAWLIQDLNVLMIEGGLPDHVVHTIRDAAQARRETWQAEADTDEQAARTPANARG